MVFYALIGIMIVMCPVSESSSDGPARIQDNTNLASRKPAWQSSSSYGGFAERAVDGNKQTFIHTIWEQSWWIVDLQSEYEINEVVITNRGGKWSHRLKNFIVAVGDTFDSCYSFDPKNFTPCVDVPETLAASETRTMPCNETVTGRYVTVYLKHQDTLQFNELEVYGVPAAVAENSTDDNTKDIWCLSPHKGKTGSNLAQRKPAWQSSTSGRNSAENAVYGNYGCAKTIEETQPWWMVDLQSEYIITEVVIKTDRVWGHTYSYTVAVGNTFNGSAWFNPSSLTPCINIRWRQGPVETKTLHCDEPVRGRYVSVSSDQNGTLSLCEVKVFGTSVTDRQTTEVAEVPETTAEMEVSKVTAKELEVEMKTTAEPHDEDKPEVADVTKEPEVDRFTTEEPDIQSKTNMPRVKGTEQPTASKKNPAGIVVGILAGLVFLGLVCVAIWYKRRGFFLRSAHEDTATLVRVSVGKEDSDFWSS